MYIYIHTHKLQSFRVLVAHPWYRVAQSHRMPYLDRYFSAKEPYNWWLFFKMTCNLRHPMGLRHPVNMLCFLRTQ